MKTIRFSFVLAATFLVLQTLSAQDVRFGPEYKELNKPHLLSVAGLHPDRALLLKCNSNLNFGSERPELLSFNTGLQLTTQVPVILTYETRYPSVEFGFESNGQIFLFGSSVWSDFKQRHLYLQRVNAKTMQLEGACTKVLEISYKGSIHRTTFTHAFSPDSSKVMILAARNLNDEDPEELAIAVMDKDMQPIWTKKVSLPYSETLFELQDIALDNDGNAFVLGKNYEEFLTGSYEKRNYEFKIFSYRRNGEQVDEYTPKLSTQFLLAMRMDVTSKEEIVCAGIYSEPGIFRAKGSYYLRINRNSKEIVQQDSKDFGDNFINSVYAEATKFLSKNGEPRVDDEILYNFQVGHIVPKADGGAFVVSEKYKTSFSHSESGTSYTFERCEIIVFGVDHNGRTEWVSKIPKYQKGYNPEGRWLSYVMMKMEDQLLFAFNDNVENLNDPAQAEPSKFSPKDKTSFIALAIVKSDGKVERRALYNDPKSPVIICPELCRQVNPKQLQLFAKYVNGKGSHLGLVTF